MLDGGIDVLFTGVREIQQLVARGRIHGGERLAIG